MILKTLSASIFALALFAGPAVAKTPTGSDVKGKADYHLVPVKTKAGVAYRVVQNDDCYATSTQINAATEGQGWITGGGPCHIDNDDDGDDDDDTN